MKAFTPTFRLIKSLQKSEKRFFMLTQGQQKTSTKDYIRIYHLIESMEQEDQNVFADLIKKSELKDVSKKIYYLQDRIIATLAQLYGRKSIDSQIQQLLREAEVIEKRGLFKLYKKRLSKAYKLADQYERFPVLLDILNKQVLFAFTHDKAFAQTVPALLTNIKKVKKSLNEVLKYRNTLHTFYLDYRTSNKARNTSSQDKLTVRKRQATVKREQEPKSFFARMNYYFAKAMVEHLLNQDHQLTQHYYQKVLDVWDAYPHMKADNPKLYTIHLTNYINSCFMVQQYEQFPAALRQMRNLIGDDELEVFQNINFTELLYYINTSEWEKARQLAVYIEQALKEYSGQMSVARELSFHMNIAVLYFALENYDKLIDYLVQIRAFRKISDREDIQLFANIMYLMAFYERNQHTPEALEAPARNIKRAIKKTGQLFNFETIILKLFQDLIWKDKKQKQLLYQQAAAQLLQLEQDQTIAKTDGLQEVSIWLEAKITKQSFREVFKERKARIKNQ